MAPRKTEAAAEHGLRLTLPGAPANAHTIPGVPGFYRPDRPTPVGGPGDPLDLDTARQVAADPGVWLELVTLEDPDAARAAYADEVRTQTGALRAVAATVQGDEAAVLTDQLASVAGDDQED